MKQIESPNNPVIKKALKTCNGDELIRVEGHKLLDEALKSGAIPQMVFIEKPEFLRGKSNLDKISYVIPRGLFKQLSSLQTPGEIIAYLQPAPAPDLEQSLQEAELVVVLDRLQDPGNIGTIIRTSEAMGASTLILLEGSCSPNNHKVIRAAMGSSFRLPIIAEVNTNNLFTLLEKHNFMTICADMKGTTLPNFSFSKKSAIFMGQEGRGLSEDILAKCKTRLAIPMYGQVESLNVATSAAMCLYEWARNKLV